MSSICAVSPLKLPKSTNNNNNNNNSNNRETNHLTESEEILNNLKLIKEKIELNGRQESDVKSGVRSADKLVMNMCFNNDFNSVYNKTNKCFHNKKSLQIDTTFGNDVMDGNQSDGYSDPSTMSSSPVSSPIDESLVAINQSLLDQKFSKLSLNDLNRYKTSVIQMNGINHCFDDEEEDYDVIRPPLLRSTSLKPKTTPPGTPHRKKIVRFADALGLDLESVRHIISDDLPTVPQSAFGGLKLNGDLTNGANGKQIPWFMQKPTKGQSKSTLMLEFIQPSSLVNFIDRVRDNKVCLENCMVSNSAGNLSITCIIRVFNVSFEKSVTLRYTLNEWLSFNEALASHIPNSGDGFSDKFSVTFSVSAGGYSLAAGQRVMFAIKYMTNTDEFWDNNMGLNYSMIYRV